MQSPKFHIGWVKHMTIFFPLPLIPLEFPVKISRTPSHRIYESECIFWPILQVYQLSPPPLSVPLLHFLVPEAYCPGPSRWYIPRAEHVV